jgi:hypothetical protein
LVIDAFVPRGLLLSHLTNVVRGVPVAATDEDDADQGEQRSTGELPRGPARRLSDLTDRCRRGFRGRLGGLGDDRHADRGPGRGARGGIRA